jgi:hypothetical protein
MAVAMLANLVDMFAFPLMPLLPVLVIYFSYYTVISGPCLLLVFLVTNIILLFLMIIHIIYRCSFHASSLTLFPHSRVFAYVHTQFGVPIQGLQSDNGHEFNNLSACSFFVSHEVLFRMSCQYTSTQNGKAEHIICTTNIVHSYFFT